MILANPPEPDRSQEPAGVCDKPAASPDDPQVKNSEELIGSEASSKKSTREERAAVCLMNERVRPDMAAELGNFDAVDGSGRERLKRHRMEMAGRVWIPEVWGQENMLKDWIDSSVFDRHLVPKGLMSARKALVEQRRRANSGSRRIKNPC